MNFILPVERYWCEIWVRSLTEDVNFWYTRVQWQKAYLQ